MMGSDSALHADCLSSASALVALHPTQTLHRISAMDANEHPGPVALSIRKARRLTLQYVCDRMAELDPKQDRIGTGNLSRFENAKEMFSVARMEALAKVYEVKLADFFPSDLPGDAKLVARRYLSLDPRARSLMHALLDAAGKQAEGVGAPGIRAVMASVQPAAKPPGKPGPGSASPAERRTHQRRAEDSRFIVNTYTPQAKQAKQPKYIKEETPPGRPSRTPRGRKRQ